MNVLTVLAKKYEVLDKQTSTQRLVVSLAPLDRLAVMHISAKWKTASTPHLKSFRPSGSLSGFQTSLKNDLMPDLV